MLNLAMTKKPQLENENRHAEKDCACNKCWKPKSEDEAKAKKWWRELYKKNGWKKDNLGYL